MRFSLTGAWRMWLGRRWLLIILCVTFALCVAQLGTKFVSHTEGSDPWASTVRFFSGAIAPSFTDENPSLPDDAEPFLSRLGSDLLRTLRYALIATSMAIPAGLILGFLASKQWWPENRSRVFLNLIQWPVRVGLSLMRSIHELIWAIFFLSAFGDAPFSACLALALPFTGTLAKVFSELMDEQNRSARQVITASGGSGVQGFLGGIFPAALPDMTSYSLYRFECALRSSAVLGFIGVETIGLSIRRSFENNYFGEVWTALYVLIATVLLIEASGHFMRHRLIHGRSRKTEADENFDESRLRKTAPRDYLLRGLALAWLALIFFAFSYGDQLVKPMGEGKRMERLSRFVSKLTPDPVAPEKSLATWDERKAAWSEGSTEVLPWIGKLWEHPGKEALINTLAMSVAAIILAGVIAGLFVPWSARSLANRQPLGLGMSGGRLRGAFGFGLRGVFVLTRAVPEYLYAFLLVGLMGPSAWPLVIALALHNLGILGRLWGEVVENQRPGNARAILQIGGNRLQGFIGALFPMSLNRFILFFFYRWESCVREATVLGMLGISSLGYYISLQQNFREYDDILFYTLLGAIVIILGDLLSDFLRRKLRTGE
ncbi:ABC transporter permease subunit [Akkermansiaceae bacterium]|nr:ABC transporter permease subunit [Akkermansiaceae bacterium]